jgi:hypothetical protein
MAFVKADLLNVTGMPQGKASYVYLSDTDTIDTITASGYFNNDDDNQAFAADDIITVRGDQGVYDIRVDAVSGAGVVTTASLVAANYETVITTNVITASETGKTFFLNLVGGFTSTLPVPALGLKYRFVVQTAPTTAYIILTNAVANIIHGSIATPEDALGAVSVVAAADTINFVANLAVIGDWCEVESDGTNWYISGMSFVQDGMTTVQAA